MEHLRPGSLGTITVRYNKIRQTCQIETGAKEPVGKAIGMDVKEKTPAPDNYMKIKGHEVTARETASRAKGFWRLCSEVSGSIRLLLGAEKRNINIPDLCNDQDVCRYIETNTKDLFAKNLLLKYVSPEVRRDVTHCLLSEGSYSYSLSYLEYGQDPSGYIDLKKDDPEMYHALLRQPTLPSDDLQCLRGVDGLMVKFCVRCHWPDGHHNRTADVSSSCDSSEADDLLGGAVGGSPAENQYTHSYLVNKPYEERMQMAIEASLNDGS